MKRSGDITAAAIVLFFGSGLLVLFMLLGIFEAALTQVPPEARYGQFFGLAFYLFFAGSGIATGVGILQLRPWARISMVALSATAICYCALGAVFMALVPSLLREAAPDASPAVGTIILFVGFLFLLVPLGIAIWWLVLFTRQRVALQFVSARAVLPEAVSIPAREEQVPVSIRVIAIAILAFTPFSLLTLPLLLLNHTSINLIWGVLVLGFPTWVYLSARVLVDVVLSIAVLKGKRVALDALIAWFFFFMVNDLLYLISPARNRFLAMIALSRTPSGVSIETMKAFMGAFLMILMCFSLLLCVTVLYFLFTRRAAFRAACAGRPGAAQ